VGARQVSASDVAVRLAAALDEVAVLRAENARLRELLGLDRERDADGGPAWEPTLFAPPATPQVRVDRSSSSAEKVALYRSLFVGRDDVFALRWQNDRPGRRLVAFGGRWLEELEAP
jgi:hypothetical protein